MLPAFITHGGHVCLLLGGKSRYQRKWSLIEACKKLLERAQYIEKFESSQETGLLPPLTTNDLKPTKAAKMMAKIQKLEQAAKVNTATT